MPDEPKVKEGEVPPPPVDPRGLTVGNYEGETDPATIIKARNAQRQYEQAGIEPPTGVIIPPPSNLPVLMTLDPMSAEVGGDDFELKLLGNNFTADSVIMFNGGIEPTTMNSPEELMTIVKPSLVSAAISVPVYVETGPNQTGVVNFVFTDPELSGAFAAPGNEPTAEEAMEDELDRPARDEEPGEVEEERNPGPFQISRVADHEDGIELTVAEGDFQSGDVVSIEATGNTNINGTYEVIEVSDNTIVVDNEYALDEAIDGKGRLTIVE